MCLFLNHFHLNIQDDKRKITLEVQENNRRSKFDEKLVFSNA